MAEVSLLEKKLRAISPGPTSGKDSKLRSLVQAVQWTASQKDVDEFLVNIERSKNALILSISSQNLVTLTNIERLVVLLSVDTQKTQSKVEKINDILACSTFSAEDRMAVEWLSPLKPWNNHDTALRAHQSGTNGWFLKTVQYEEWSKRGRDFIWISGHPGAGKTVLLYV
ncbi:unnamed protein product [Discula destructiva]